MTIIYYFYLTINIIISDNIYLYSTYILHIQCHNNIMVLW